MQVCRVCVYICPEPVNVVWRCVQEGIASLMVWCRFFHRCSFQHTLPANTNWGCASQPIPLTARRHACGVWLPALLQASKPPRPVETRLRSALVLDLFDFCHVERVKCNPAQCNLEHLQQGSHLSHVRSTCVEAAAVCHYSLALPSPPHPCQAEPYSVATAQCAPDTTALGAARPACCMPGTLPPPTQSVPPVR